ncbi:MAG: 23S rRNA (uracil1939-C5)-methyltransferase [Verrucomicrobia bacterium]|nr:MAG: 23S rRNA (uracil1939-C5)-methyltransferase [Verrucomicrobiota bacterium]
MQKIKCELLIERVSYGGAGIGKLGGKVVFVPFTIPGERVLVEIVRQKKNFAEAALLSVLEPSPDRRKALCPVFGVCGGCAYQHVDYATQLEWKADQVRDLLERVGRIAAPSVAAALASPKEWAFRNRIRVHSGDGLTGFYSKHGHKIVDVESCAIASAEVNEELLRLRATRPAPGETSLAVKREVRYFEQTNDGAAEVLVRLVENSAGEGRGTLVDAYCGAGFFGHRLAARFERVVGIESHEGAVAKARRQGLENEQYICGDVAAHLGDILETADRARTLVLLDPPAAGVEARVTDLLIALPVQQVVYVSCDPATLARDLGALVRGGYVLGKVTPVDMFPQTADIEVVAELTYRV